MKHAPQDAGIKEHYWQDKKKKKKEKNVNYKNCIQSSYKPEGY